MSVITVSKLINNTEYCSRLGATSKYYGNKRNQSGALRFNAIAFSRLFAQTALPDRVRATGHKHATSSITVATADRNKFSLIINEHFAFKSTTF
jgi:hypothetical protein